MLREQPEPTLLPGERVRPGARVDAARSRLQNMGVHAVRKSGRAARERNVCTRVTVFGMR